MRTDLSTYLVSSVAERLMANRCVNGANPLRGASFCRSYKLLTLFDKIISGFLRLPAKVGAVFLTVIHDSHYMCVD